MASASEDGRKITVSIISLPPRYDSSWEKKTFEPQEVRIRVKGDDGKLPVKATAIVLAGDANDENTFEDPDRVKPVTGEVRGKGDEWTVQCEPFSLTVVTFEM